MNAKTAVLLVNLGTPDALCKKAIKSYLREFLLDPRVITLPWPLRWLLVNAFIIPFRSTSTLHAYKSIWTTAGSPLLLNSRNLQQKLNLQLQQLNNQQSKQEQNFDVYLAMRYGKPCIADVLTRLQLNNYTRITIVPLYPQYASASTGSVLEKSLKHLSDFRYFPKITCLNEFYCDYGYIISIAKSVLPYLNNQKSSHHILFSYHGIPKQQLDVSSSCNKNSTTNMCKDDQHCPANTNNRCYRAQCYETTRAVVKQLELSKGSYTTCFQSRLGKLPWVKPYTDEVIKQLRANNVTEITVVCPSFVVDCLETLEEIGMRLKSDWLKLGGTKFNLVPCLNDNDYWVKKLARLVINS